MREFRGNRSWLSWWPSALGRLRSDKLRYRSDGAVEQHPPNTSGGTAGGAACHQQSTAAAVAKAQVTPEGLIADAEAARAKAMAEKSDAAAAVKVP